MAIPLTGTNGYFTRIGQVGNIIADTNTWQNLINTDSFALYEQFTDNEALIDGLAGAQSSALNTQLGFLSYCTQLAINITNVMVLEDQPLLSATNLLASLQAIIAQMISSVDSVQVDTVGNSISSNLTYGNGVLIVSDYTNLGLRTQQQIPEILTISCTQDSTSNAQLAGQEVFTSAGQVQASSPLSWDYPIGSGTSVSLSAINGNTNNGSNLLYNSNWALAVANVPTNWSVVVGTPGTSIKVITSPIFGVAPAQTLEFIGQTSPELTAVKQQFNISTGNSSTILNVRQYAFNCWLQLSSASITGVLTIELVDSSGTVLQDYSGNNCSATVAMSTLTTSWSSFNGSFQTPYILPTDGEVFLQLKITTGLANTIELYIGNLAFGATTQQYQGGPGLAIFSGDTNFFVPDNFVVTLTNDFGGATNLKDFQTLFQRLFNMSSLGLQLPSSGSPTIPNSLID